MEGETGRGTEGYVSKGMDRVGTRWRHEETGEVRAGQEAWSTTGRQEAPRTGEGRRKGREGAGARARLPWQRGLQGSPGGSQGCGSVSPETGTHSIFRDRAGGFGSLHTPGP